MAKNNFGTWYNDILNSANPFKAITEMNKFEKGIGIADLQGKLSLTALRMQLVPNRFGLSAIHDARSLMGLNLADSISSLQNKFSGSAFTPLTALPETFNNKLSAITLAENALKQLNANKGIYDLQLSLSSRLSKEYFEVTKMSQPSWIASTLRAKDQVAQISALDIINANTLKNITETYYESTEEKVDAEANIKEINQLLSENIELKKEIQNIYISFAKNVTSKINRKKKIKDNDLKEPYLLFSDLVHKHILKNSLLSRQALYTFVVIFKDFFYSLIIGLLLTAYGSAIHDSIVDDSKKTLIQQPVIFNKIHHVTSNPPPMVDDFVIRNTKVYLRNTLKAKYIGKIKKHTTVLILRERRGWCYVEALVVIYNQKSKTTIEKVKKGWIMKKNLDYFQ